MRRFSRHTLPVMILLGSLVLVSPLAQACTNLLVSRGASTDGSVFVSFSVDGTGLAQLRISPASTEQDLESEEQAVRDWTGPTYKVVNHMNEFQVAIGETTTNGRPELTSTSGGLTYDRLMFLALKRCKTAREAIKEIDRLMQTYGYGSTGETLSVADKNEVWIMEIMGKGEEKGAVWVAGRVPEGYITAHANMSRVTTFPLNDPENWLYSPDVVSFAVRKGFYDPESGEPFSFRDAYHPNISRLIQRACAGRIWSIFRRAAPSLNLSSDFYRVVPDAEPYPLFIKPDEKIDVRTVMALMRDHYEGTPWDMTKGVAAGPFGSPYRYRDLTWTVDGKTYAWERPISSQQAACTWISQARNWLPDPIGGIYWYTPDDAYTSCFAPFYVGITDVPKAYRSGRYEKLSRESAWWVFNMVSNYAYDRYSKVIGEIQTVQQNQEELYAAMIPIIDKMALERAKESDEEMREFITNFCVNQGDALFQRWGQLLDEITEKNIDGYVKQEGGPPAAVGYDETWLRRVVDEDPEKFYVGESEEH
ncbi:MAG: hypothetical protein DWQ31_06380 [Planctomycetota bacterium]|nr:MAG: hypothetical protein DWQ31_06380 [Planctomycetota bacterium]